MIHGAVIDSYVLGNTDGFQVSLFITAEPDSDRPKPYHNRVILHAVAEREGVALGFSAYGPITYEGPWDNNTWIEFINYTNVALQAVEDARATLGTLVR